MRTKKVKSTGRFGTRYGKKLKDKVRDIELKQRKKQKCPFCSHTAKRVEKGIWLCKSCKKKFSAGAYYLE